MYYLFMVILVFFAAIGVANTMLSVVFHCTKIDDDNSYLVIIPKSDKQFEPEFVLRSAATKLKRLGKSAPKQILCINNRLSESTVKKCELICKDYDYIRIISIDDFKELTN